MAEIILEIKDVKKDFGEKGVLDGITTSVKSGEVVVILGPSGCGKSTLLRCINGLEKIQSGSILLDGDPVAPDEPSITAIRQRVGMVFQNYELFPHLNVIDNMFAVS